MHILGEIALNISTALYLIWFVPQIKMTFNRKSTSGLSLLMHSILMLGYIMDLMYGFGRHLPIQYRLVTIIGLTSLLIEHFQFARYGLQNIIEKRLFYGISLAFLILFISVIFNVFVDVHSKLYYNIAGFISMFCWLAFLWPQIIKNFVNKSTQGLSTSFVWITVITSICDIISAYALNWALPSKISAPVGLIKKSILITQCYYYKEDSQVPDLNASYS